MVERSPQYMEVFFLWLMAGVHHRFDGLLLMSIPPVPIQMFLALSSVFTHLPLLKSFLLIWYKDWKRFVDSETQKNWLKWAVKLLKQRNEDLSKSFPRHCWPPGCWTEIYQIIVLGRQTITCHTEIYNLIFQMFRICSLVSAWVKHPPRRPF